MNHMPFPEDQHEARLMVGDPAAQAYEWIKAYADNLSDQCAEYSCNDYQHDGVSIDELISAGESQLGDGWGEYISRGGVFEGEHLDPTFWDKLAILKGIEIPSEKRNNFFSCSC